MENDSLRMRVLLDGLAEGGISEEEVRELLSLVDKGEDETPLKEKVQELWMEHKAGEPLPAVDWEKMYSEIIQTPVIGQRKRKKINFARIAAAAAVILFIGLGAWFLLRKPQADTSIAKQSQEVRFKNDVPPGSNGAILTLGNGQQIVLDSAQNGVLAKQGNTAVIKQDNQLSYEAGGATSIAVTYNTITTPRGRQYPNLTLADGTKVWLDAGSSIRFPTAFTGNERSVEVTGQVWFDVVHNEKMPFRVMAKGTEIRDLGTQFNVNAYDDEPGVKVTLLQGAIQIQSATLKVGQQAQVSPDGKLNIADAVNLEQVMAWKNGVFDFENADVAAVMRQISRWYDVDIVYDQEITKRVSLLNVPRSETLTGILKILEMTGNVKFVIEGKKITVYLP